MLGDIFDKSAHKEIATIYYAQIVRNYPLSGFVPDAKSKLTAFKVPVPQPDQKAMAWMVAEQNAPRQHDSFVKRPLALVRTGPHAEFIAAAKTGAPNLQPEADNTSATDILSGGNKSQLGGGGAGGTGAVVEVVTPGTGGTPEGAADGSPGETPSAQPPADGTAPSPGTAGDANAAAASDPKPAAAPDAGANAVAAPNTAPTTDVKPAAATDAGANPVTTTTTTGTGTATGTGTDSKAAAATTATAQNADGTPKTDDSSTAQNGKESSSKKKKGLRKILPW
jgi:hypothetical protein